MGGRLDFVLRSAKRAGVAGRRVSLIVVLALGLGVAVPSAHLPAPRTDDSLFGWIADFFAARPVWAGGDERAPKQQRGTAQPNGHYATAARFKDTLAERKAKGELARYQPHQQTGKIVTTPASTGFDRATSKRVPAAADAHSDVYRNADGTYTRRTSLHPVNFRAADGSWRPIDNTLRAGADGRLAVTANAFQLSFAGGQSSDPTHLVRLTVPSGEVFAYGLAGAAAVPARLDREQVTYPGVFRDVDLELGAVAAGVKESLVLRSPDAPTEYVFPLTLSGLTPRLAADGSLELVDAKGQVKIQVPLGYLEDAAVDASGAGAMSHAIRFELTEVAGGPALKVILDQAWLADKARKFPVVYDPTGVLYSNTGDTYVQSSPTPEVNRNAETSVATGTWNAGGQKAKGLLPFPNFGSTYAGKRMSAVDLNLFMTYQGNGTTCTAKPFYVNRVTSSWNTSVTYPTFPSFTSSIGTLSPSSSAACGNSGGVRNTGVWISVPLNVNEVNEWVTGTANYGLALTASESDSLAWKRFTSTDVNLTCNHSTYGAIQCDPFIDVTYSDNGVPVIDARYPANNTAVNTLTPELVASGHDVDGWPNKGLRYQFLVYNDQGALVHDSGWDADGIYQLPPGVLQWGKTYLYAAKIDDFSSSGPAAPVTYAFSTQVPQPMSTATLAQNGGKGYEASTGNYTTSDTDAQVTTAGPALAVTRDYNNLDTRVNGAFGRGWSSIVDMRATEGYTASGALQTLTVRYPAGQEVAFGRNNDGTWAPPSGR